MLIEIEARHTNWDVRDFFSEIEALGYRGSFLSPDGKWTSINAFLPEVHQNIANQIAADVNVTRRIPWWRQRTYVNNFLFAPV